MLVIVVFQILITSCSNYYKAISSPFKSDMDKAAEIDSLHRERRTFILRNGKQAFCMNDLVINAAEKTVNCTLDTLSIFNRLYVGNGERGKMRYKKNYSTDLAVLSEAHIYIDPDSTVIAGTHSLALNKVKKIEVIEKDKNRTTNSYVLGWLGITAGIFIIGAIFVGIAMSGMSFTLGPY